MTAWTPTTIGPLVNQAAVDKVDRQVRNAVELGATCTPAEDACWRTVSTAVFYAPTLLSGSSPGC